MRVTLLDLLEAGSRCHNREVSDHDDVDLPQGIEPMKLAMVGLVWAASLLSVLEAKEPAESRRDYPIQPVSFERVELTDSFWRPRIDTNTRVTVPICFTRCEETGRIRNFVAAAKRDPALFRGIRFDDSDVFKIIEGASYTLAVEPNEELDTYLDELIAKIAAAQEPDGYLFTVKTSGAKDPYGQAPRWTRLDHSHELYNIGHLYEAAVAHYRATGKRSLLEVAIKSADLVGRVFGPEPDRRKDIPGHEEIEIGLVKLYRTTGDAKYLKLAKFFVDMRGRLDGRARLYGEYAQDHMPLQQQAEAVGHAVRGGYYYAAVADIAALTGDRSYIDAIDRIWEDVVLRKLYLTGSVGQHGAGEGYAGPYKLSNLMAYNETCASIALVLWNHRMFLLHGDAKYIDVLERSLYNGVLSGVALSGDKFFYPNPLECDMVFRFNHGSFERSPWFGTSCCPSNIVRTIPSIPGYVYAVRDRSLYVNLFVSGKARVEIGTNRVEIEQQTEYPWQGNVRMKIDPKSPTRFAVRVRIPGWARGKVLPSDLYRYVESRPVDWKIAVNGRSVEAKVEAGYAVLDRLWKPGDQIELTLPMVVRRVIANDKVEPDRGRVAIERGPLVYCVEGADHGGRVRHLWLADEHRLKPRKQDDLLGGVVVLTGTARAVERTESGTLEDVSRPIMMVPYYAWCHRGANEMRVWLPRSSGMAEPLPLPTIASSSRVSASHCWRSDTVAALHDQAEPKSSGDHDIPRMTWWDHRGTREWVQYDFEKPTEVARVEVYWFDDTGRGQCRLPKSWRVLYRDGNEWRPVEATSRYQIAGDRWNSIEFAPVTTNGLRIEVELREGFSGGILEWKVDPARRGEPPR